MLQERNKLFDTGVIFILEVQNWSRIYISGKEYAFILMIVQDQEVLPNNWQSLWVKNLIILP